MTSGGPAPSAGATFPGRNGRIAYSRSDDGKNSSIWVIDPDSSHETQLTTRGGGHDSFPSWSPDGSKLAFLSDRGTPGRSRTFIVNADGSDLHLLLEGSDYEHLPASGWTADGKVVVVETSVAQMASRVFVVEPDGTGKRLLSPELNPAVAQDYPAFSPDGLLAIVRQTVLGRSALYLMNSDGSDARQLDGETAFIEGVSWAPESGRVAFSDPGLGFTIYTSRPDGSVRRRISPLLADRRQVAPQWSPDGKAIVYARFLPFASSGSDLILANADGTGETVIRGERSFPSWQPLQGTSPRPFAVFAPVVAAD